MKRIILVALGAFALTSPVRAEEPLSDATLAGSLNAMSTFVEMDCSNLRMNKLAFDKVFESTGYNVHNGLPDDVQTIAAHALQELERNKAESCAKVRRLWGSEGTAFRDVVMDK